MKLSDLNLTEQTGLGAAIIVFGGIGSVVTIVATIWADRGMVVSLAAGFAFALSISLFVANTSLRLRIKELAQEKIALTKEIEEAKNELAAANKRSDHWSSTANNVSQAVLTVLNMSKSDVEKPPPRRPRPKTAPAENANIDVKEANQ